MAVPDWQPPIPLERQKIYKDEWKNSCQNHRIIFEFCIQLLTSCWLSCWLTTDLFQAALMTSNILPAVLCAGFSLAVGLLPAVYWPLICCAVDLPNLRAVVLSALAPIPLWPSFALACCWPPGWTPIYILAAMTAHFSSAPAWLLAGWSNCRLLSCPADFRSIFDVVYIFSMVNHTWSVVKLAKMANCYRLWLIFGLIKPKPIHFQVPFFIFAAKIENIMSKKRFFLNL